MKFFTNWLAVLALLALGAAVIAFAVWPAIMLFKYFGPVAVWLWFFFCVSLFFAGLATATG